MQVEYELSQSERIILAFLSAIRGCIFSETENQRIDDSVLKNITNQVGYIFSNTQF